MKNKNKILALILSITFSWAIFPLNSLLPTVRATYVEGEIIIDTVWTLVDSPFILSGNITISEGVTLTIEPGVEVRFGGKFSIIVNGRLVAKGTSEFNRLIKFTSNKETSEPGDWGTLYFNGNGQPPSLLENCIIEYGANGITMVNGELMIRSSVIRLNSENGVMALNGSINLGRDSLICNNTASGIYISGGSVRVEASTIKFNEEGVTLAGNLTTSSINITQNIIAQNVHGIKLGMENYTKEDLIIRKNRVHSNDYGFYVSANNTIIEWNYVYNNGKAGISYKQGTHEAHFNDIYNNTCGMDVANANVNATYNYWGHWSGPYHKSLNPRGKGNPISGDAANAHFIFFLSASIDHKNNPPKAVLWTDKVIVAPGQNVTFVGTNSFDVDEYGRVDYYLYEFGDGESSGWTTLSMFFHTYRYAREYNATLQVKDDFNRISNTTSTIVRVLNLPPLEVSLTLSNYIVDYNATVSATVHVTNGTYPVALAYVNLFAVAKGFFANITGSTNSSGYCTITFVAPNVKDVTDIRIMARASKSGYADGSDYKYLRVLPPLNVALEPDREKIFSEETMMVRVNVTDAHGEPVVDVHLRLFRNGSLIGEGLTDINGTIIFEFTAPLVYEYSVLTIRVEAFKDLYAIGFDTCVIGVMPRELNLIIYREAETIFSEESTPISVLVYWRSEPVQYANVSLHVNYGSFDQASAMTDSSGLATFTFIAPKTTVNITANIIANAAKDGYVSGVNWTVIEVMPKVLVVHVTADRNVTVSEEEINVVVHVEYDGVSIPNANVTLSLNVTEFAPLTALTNNEGDATFTFNMTAVPHDMVVAITATARKDGYAENSYTLLLTAKPGNLTVNVYAIPSIVKPGEFSKIIVYVFCENRPIANANVTVTAAIEGFTPRSLVTDANGYCELYIQAPSTTRTLNVGITVDVAKIGYNSVHLPDWASFSVVPEAGGIPWLTILLVLIPVLLVVLIVVLVKLGVIQFSFGEEEER